MKEVIFRFLRFHCMDRYHCSVQYFHLIEDIIERFERDNPHVRVESTVMRNWYQLMHLLNNSITTDDTPDVFHTSGAGLLKGLVNRGLVYDLSDDLGTEWRRSFVPASLLPCRVAGREYAVPLEQGFIFVWYNTRIFRQLGLRPPATYSELLSICVELRKAGVIPFSLGGVEKWFGDFFFSYLFQRIGGDEMFESDLGNSEDRSYMKECFIEAAQEVRNIAKLDVFYQDWPTVEYEQQRQRFFSGKAAMWLNGNRLLSYVLAEAPHMVDQLDAFLFPAYDSGRGATTTVIGGSLATYAVSGKSRHKKEALDLLRAITDEQAAHDVVFSMGDVPAVSHVSTPDYPSDLHSHLASMLFKADSILAHYFKHLPPMAAGVYLNTVFDLLNLEIGAPEAFDTLEDALVKASDPGEVPTDE